MHQPVMIAEKRKLVFFSFLLIFWRYVVITKNASVLHENTAASRLPEAQCLQPHTEEACVIVAERLEHSFHTGVHGASCSLASSNR